jgi:hypothetical protein
VCYCTGENLSLGCVVFVSHSTSNEMIRSPACWRKKIIGRPCLSKLQRKCSQLLCPGNRMTVSTATWPCEVESEST